MWRGKTEGIDRKQEQSGDIYGPHWNQACLSKSRNQLNYSGSPAHLPRARQAAGTFPAPYFMTKLYLCLCLFLKDTLHFNMVKMFPSFVWRSVRKLPAWRDTPGFMLCPEQDSRFTLPLPARVSLPQGVLLPLPRGGGWESVTC